MVLTRRSSVFLLVFAVWSWVIWVTLVKNIWADPRSFTASGAPAAFLIVHVILAAISLIFGTIVGFLGWRGLRAGR